MRRASSLRWPRLSMGSVPPLESIRIFDHINPVLMLTDATFDMAMLSSSEPSRRGLMRETRSGVISIRTGKKRLPAVHRLALKTCRSSGIRKVLVGLGRVELPTSPLSGVRSSHLSYRPAVLAYEKNTATLRVQV